MTGGWPPVEDGGAGRATRRQLAVLAVVALVPVAVPVVATWASAPDPPRPAVLPPAGTSAGPGPDRPTALAGPARPPARPGAAADLELLSVSWTPTRPRAGQLVLFTATVRNSGTAPAAAPGLGVTVEVDRNPVSWRRDGRPLLPAQTRTYTVDAGPLGYAFWFATAGRHSLRAVVDDRQAVVETDESNNVLEVDLLVR